MTEEQRRAAQTRADMEYRERSMDHANLNGTRLARMAAEIAFEQAQRDHEAALQALVRVRRTQAAAEESFNG